MADSEDDLYAALREAEPSIPDVTPAQQNSFIGKIQPVDGTRMDQGYEENASETEIMPGDEPQQGSAGNNNNPLPYLPDVQVFDTDGSILYAGHGSGVWPIVIDGDQTTTNVSWCKIAWCEPNPDDPTAPGTPGTRFVLMSPFVPD
jgi:hypothetical protein